MKIEFDPAKNARNVRKHGLAFAAVALLDWDKAWFKIDNRKDYGEERFVAYAACDGRLYAVCFTPRPNGYRILSFRRANKREQSYYDEKTADQ